MRAVLFLLLLGGIAHGDAQNCMLTIGSGPIPESKTAAARHCQGVTLHVFCRLPRLCARYLA
jgi:hypothetical protein